MNITTFIKTVGGRLSYFDKWLSYYDGEWVVLQRPPYAKKNRCLYRGDNLEEALIHLKGE